VEKGGDREKEVERNREKENFLKSRDLPIASFLRFFFEYSALATAAQRSIKMPLLPPTSKM
jgi:hypothetical protein